MPILERCSAMHYRHFSHVVGGRQLCANAHSLGSIQVRVASRTPQNETPASVVSYAVISKTQDSKLLNDLSLLDQVVSHAYASLQIQAFS